MRLARLILVGMCLAMTGCTSVYWDEDWQYVGTQKGIPQSQQLRVTSEPAATVKVNGEVKGQTPLAVTLPYFKTVVTVEKHQYEKSPGGTAKILQTRQNNEEVIQSVSHVLTFEAAGYHDLVMPVATPYADGTLHVTLNKSGIINDIECKLRIEARREYFPPIERIIREHAVESKYTTDEPEPVQLEGQNIYRLTFSLIVKDSIRFDELVNALLKEAKQNLFVFDILDAKVEATFSTNVMDTWIDHVVRGRVRRGSILFFIQNKQVHQIDSVEEDGRFAFKVRLSPDEKSVYLVSKYKDILRVYTKVDVFSQEEEELTEDLFARELGLPVETLRKMIE